MISQNKKDLTYILKDTNTEKLHQIAKDCNNKYQEALKKAKKLHTKMDVTNSKKEKGQFSGFDSKGKPVYVFETSLNTAKVSNVNNIWQGGISGLNLNGAGINIGHWETGFALPTHQELEGRIFIKDDAQESTEHATHTAGILIGQGVYQAARGMASGATISSYTTRNRNAEIAEFSALGGIISSHSYAIGYLSGNKDYYGAYSNNSREWDEIIYNAPYSTLCNAAANYRLSDDKDPTYRGYNTVLEYSSCKNTITVGAVKNVLNYNSPNDVKLWVNSSSGPTDDWRIKPDICALGESVISAGNRNNSDYRSLSGTSMSTPVVAGAITLLQQHYHTMNNVYMKAATVKALLISTTKEAGSNDGPDFEYGWGLLDAEKAAKTISKNGSTTSINELTLQNGDIYTTTVDVDGTSPFTCAIAWTDPAGNAVQKGINELTPRLINDLDIRVTRNNIEYEPWTITPNSSLNNFSDAATKGDNFRDNVERIDVKYLPEGTYNITVSHKNTLMNGAQDFSMIISGMQETATLSQHNITKTNNTFIVYPNPSYDGYFNIVTQNTNTSTKQEIEIYDMSGRLVTNNTFHGQKTKLNLSKLNFGTYLLKVKSNNKTSNRLIIIGK